MIRDTWRAIVKIILCLGCLGGVQVNGQALHSNTYGLISEVVREDTILTKVKKRVIWAKMKQGTMTMQDSIDYVERIKNRGLNLYPVKINADFKKFLKQDLELNGNMSMEYGAVTVKKIVLAIPDSGIWAKTAELDGFTFLENIERGAGYHQFSDPVHIEDNLYLLLHSRIAIDINIVLEYLLFSVDKDGGYSFIRPYGIIYN